MSLLFIFLDGIGLAPSGPDNPLTTARMPTIAALLGGPLTSESVQGRDGLLLRPIDANLGVPGLPQSGTGHTALLGGFNAPAAHGRHQPHFPPVALRPRLAEQSMFHAVLRAGRTAAFANLFGPNYWVALASGKLRRAASAIAAEGAGVRLRTLADGMDGAAVAWDITGEHLRLREPEIPLATPEDAGARLAALARTHDLVYFECYLPDLAAHGRLSQGGRWQPGGASLPAEDQIQLALELIDGCVGAAAQHLGPRDTLLITSDHGNIESRSAQSHTRNPVPLLASGAAAHTFSNVQDISEVAAAVVRAIA